MQQGLNEAEERTWCCEVEGELDGALGPLGIPFWDGGFSVDGIRQINRGETTTCICPVISGTTPAPPIGGPRWWFACCVALVSRARVVPAMWS